MKFQVNVGGKHQATVSLELASDGTFAGSIDSDEFGQGAIQDGKTTDGALQGTVNLDGYSASFSAKLDGQAITGNLRYGWFFSEDFTGVQTA